MALRPFSLHEPYPFFARIAAINRLAQPAFACWSARTRHKSPAPTSLLTALPAPTIAPAPMVTGAIRDEFDPINAPSPITVLYLKNPS